MPQSLRDIQSLLTAYGLSPKHRHGQNFLHDANHMAKIVAAAGVGPGDLVLEVGPGTGGLSERLIEGGAELLAVEIDSDLEPILQARLVAPNPSRVRMIIGDVMAGKHKLHPAVAEALGDRRFKLIANLPYQIASPLLAVLAVQFRHMTAATVTIQREVADRLTAAPGGRAYGPLGIIIGALCHVETIGRIAPTAFWPKPKVESAIVRLIRRDRPLTADPDRLQKLIARLFQQRRKKITTILHKPQPWPQTIAPDARPQDLSIGQLEQLAQLGFAEARKS